MSYYEPNLCEYHLEENIVNGRKQKKNKTATKKSATAETESSSRKTTDKMTRCTSFARCCCWCTFGIYMYMMMIWWTRRRKKLEEKKKHKQKPNLYSNKKKNIWSWQTNKDMCSVCRIVAKVMRAHLNNDTRRRQPTREHYFVCSVYIR